MPTSPAHLAANAANAQHSTGPRTPEGKAHSSQNARTHGLTARDLIIADDEREEFDELLNDYKADVDPQRGLQQTIFEALVASAWNLRRIRRMEAALCPNTISYEELINNEDLQKKLDRLVRHKTSIERTFHRSLNQLKALQTNAAIAATLPISAKNIPPLSSAIEISKRTQQFEPKYQTWKLKDPFEDPPPASASDSTPDNGCAP